MNEKDKQEMISAVKTLQSICEKNRRNIHSCNTCPFDIYCARPFGIPIPADWTEYTQNERGTSNG